MNLPSQLDRIIWRINGIIILAILIGASGTILFGLFTSYRDSRRSETLPPVVRAEADGEDSNNLIYRISHFNQVPNTPVFIGSLVDHSSASIGFSKYSSSAKIKNYVFYDSDSGEIRWLLKNNAEEIRITKDLKFALENTEKPVLLWRIYVLQKASSDASSKSPLFTIAVSNDVGAFYNEILDEVSHFESAELLEQNRLVVVFRRFGSTLLTEFDLATMSLLRTVEILKAEPLR